MTQNNRCPQCGDLLSVNLDNRARCLMCGWGGADGIDISPHNDSKLAPILNKSRRWKFSVMTAAVIAALVLPTIIMYPVNQVRADQAIDQAKTQMDKRLYASAAKTLHNAPRDLVLPQKTQEVRKLLADNVRWGKDSNSVKGAKASLLDEDPEAALAELEDLEEDFPLGDEAAELMDLAQDFELEGDLELTDDLLDDIAFIPDDPELEGLDDLDEGLEGLDEPTASPQAPASGGQSQPEDQLEIPEDDLTAADENELATEAEVAPDPPADQAPVQNNPAQKPTLRVLHRLNKASETDFLYSLDLTQEVQPGKDRKSGKTGYKKVGTEGKLYDRKVGGYEKRIIPLYRYYSSKNTDHYYSTNPKFSTGNARANYQKQLVAGYIGKWSEKQKKCFAGKIPLYGVYNSKTKTNFYSSSKATANNLVANNGFKNLRVVGCMWP